MSKEKKNETEEQIVEELDNQQVEEQVVEETTVEAEAEEKDSFEIKYNAVNDSYLRLMAEFDNYKKRTLKEKAELIKNGGEKVVLATLPIVDNFERAIDNMLKSDDVNAIKEGVELIYQQMLSALKQQGVSVIETANQDFDTDKFEAITTIPAPTEELKGKVIDCVQKGYLLNDKIIRYPKVVVGE